MSHLLICSLFHHHVTETRRFNAEMNPNHQSVGVVLIKSLNFIIIIDPIFKLKQLIMVLTCVRRLTHVIAIGLSVRPSVTQWYCVETAQPILKLSSLPGSPMILVLWGPNFFTEFQWEHPNGGAKCKKGRKKLQFPTNISL